MIAVLRNGTYEISVLGHAGQAPKGQDIVCAGASALLYSLAAMLRGHSEDCLELEISLESGAGRVKATPTVAFANACLSAFEVVLRGFELLAKQYPGYIRFEDLCIDTDSPA